MPRRWRTRQASSRSTAKPLPSGPSGQIGAGSFGRVRRVGLAACGRAAMQAGREVRAELAARLGAPRLEATRVALLEVLDAVGGAAAVRARRVPIVP